MTYEIFLRRGRPKQRTLSITTDAEVQGMNFWEALIQTQERLFGTIDEYTIREQGKTLVWVHPEIEFVRSNQSYISGIDEGRLVIKDVDETIWERMSEYADRITAKLPQYYDGKKHRAEIIAHLRMFYEQLDDTVQEQVYAWMTATETRRTRIPMTLDQDDLVLRLGKEIKDIGYKNDIPSYIPKTVKVVGRQPRTEVVDSGSIMQILKRMSRHFRH